MARSMRMGSRAGPMATLVVGVLLIPAGLGLGYSQQVRERTVLVQQLRSAVVSEVAALENYFERARAIILLTAHSPSFARFYQAPGTRQAKVEEGGQAVRLTEDALAYLEQLYPNSIGEACFIDASGPENSRVVRGDVAPPDELSPDESGAPFFHPTFALPPGQAYQAKPYVSPDTGEWVISNSTPVPGVGGRAIVHFEVTIESFRRQAATAAPDAHVRVVDTRSGRVVIDSGFPQLEGRPLGPTGVSGIDPDAISGTSGLLELEGNTAAFGRLDPAPGNANRWAVVATPASPQAVFGGAGVASVITVAVALLLLLVGGLGFRNAQRALQEAASTDPLTRLGNRRSLLADLEDRFAASRARPFTLALFDLDGFKGYNDAFGHPAGDALLVRLGGKLTRAVANRGAAYRVGGDEFCVVSDDPDAESLVQAARTALSETGEGFLVTCSSGTVSLPGDAANSTEALRRADARLYEHKSARPSSPEQQSADVLLRALHERYPELQGHLDAVGRLVAMVAERLGLPTDMVRTIRRAGELHDVGKVAIPDQILRKPGPLDADEWEFMKTHSAVGERILDAAPALTSVARLVGAHHERFDGTGYPYGWSGPRIPVGARIIAVCDAYHAMTSGRAYRPAISHEEAIKELLRCAGNQFDPTVVEAFLEIADRARETTSDSAVAHGH